MTRPFAAVAAALALGGCALLPRLDHLVPGEDDALPKEAQVFKALTQDGWSIHLVHYRPSGPRKGLPVLLCHGIGANARNMDLDANHSLARWLAAQGRDSFTMSLRGTGYSDHANAAKGRSYLYTLDTFASEDLPAAIAKVREITGAPGVDFIGHSMGGLVAYIYLARGGTGLNAGVTLGSPARLEWGGQTESLLRRISPAIKPMYNVPVPLLAELLLPFYSFSALYSEVNPAFALVLYNPENVTDQTWRKLLQIGLGSISGPVLKQFGLWLQRDSMVSADDKLDYLKLMRVSRTPMLVIAGKVDHTAPPQSVRAGFDALGGEKTFFIAGEENGFEHDYGHMDLVIGERAATELWPRLVRFLDRQDAAAAEVRAD